MGKYQLARFNDSATTEEVDLAINNTYADKVAALVAIRTQDIGMTQKYVDDLEILKDEIALSMIVKMEELEEQFKKTNVRRKVNEAKENGISDTDIKEILFPDFCDSGEGLSLIGARASTADALLSSFQDGMESLLDGTYYEKLGILQYGNGGGDSDSVDGGAGGGDSDAHNNGAGIDDDAPDGPPEGGRLPDGAARGEGGGPPDDDEDENDETEEETEELNDMVSRHLNGSFSEIMSFERIVRDLEEKKANGYVTDPSLRVPEDDYLNNTPRLTLLTRHLDHFTNLLENTANDLMHQLIRFFDWFNPRYLLVIANHDYYKRVYKYNNGIRSGNELTAPEELVEFADLSVNDDRMRYLLSTRLEYDMKLIANRFDFITESLQKRQDNLQSKIKLEENEIRILHLYPPPTPAPNSSEGAGPCTIEERSEVNSIVVDRMSRLISDILLGEEFVSNL